MKKLRPYQQNAINAIKASLDKGEDKMLLCMATGLGKTFTAVKAIEQLGFKQALWITHRDTLTSQSALAFIRDKFDDSLANHVQNIGFTKYVRGGGIFAGGEFKMGLIKGDVFEPRGNVVISSTQTIHKRLDLLPPDHFDFIIVDECFPKGTLVDEKPIETIKVGDFVKSYNHQTNNIEYKEVKRLFKNEIKSNLIKVNLANGKHFICTDNHPIYTNEHGYVTAKFIYENYQIKNIFCVSLFSESEKGILLHCSQKLFGLWRSLYSKTWWEKTSVLLKKMYATVFERSKRKSCNYKKGKWGLERTFKQDEEEKPNVDGWYKGKNGFQNDGKDIFRTRGKWRTHKAPTNVTFSDRIRNGIPNINSSSKRQFSKPTELLQSGFSQSFSEISNRGGWQDSQTKEMEVFGQTENGNFECVRVASCEIYKRGSREFNEQMCEENYVYNIEVEDNHNYFVENILVHNCHWGTKLVQKSLDHFSAPRCGLSATPYSKEGVLLSSLYNEVIFEYNIKEGIRDRFLCELDGIRIKTNISLDDVHTVGGEFNQRELADEVNCYKRNRLVADSYIKYANGLKGIFFCVDIQHCKDLLEVFIEAGINAKVVASDEEHKNHNFENIKAFNEGRIDILINVEILTTGFDGVDVGVIGMARPTKSLVLFMQSIGRGTRLKSPGFVAKNGQKCILLDYIDNTSKHSLVNTFTLDRGLDPEERVFITSENREKLIESRRRRIEGKHDKDERIQLLPILTPKFKTTIKSVETVSEVERLHLKNFGYDVEDTVYTKENYREIVGSFPATSEQITELRKFGFDMSAPITRAQAGYTLWMYRNDKIKQTKWNK